MDKFLIKIKPSQSNYREAILKDILYKVGIEAVHGATDITISKMEFDSRKIELNDVFVAIRGTLSDGHHFIDKALSLGAIAVICEEFPNVIVNGVTYIKVKDTNEALAFLAANSTKIHQKTSD